MLTTAWHITQELAPWLLLGAAAGGLLHLLVPAAWLQRHLTGRGGVWKAALIGVPLPLCSCGVIPVALSLRKQGASRGATTAFLISTPQTGLDSIFVSGALLGWPFALFKLASALVLGVVGGVLADVASPAESIGELPPAPAEPHPRGGSPWRDVASHALMLIRSLWRWLAVGIVVSTLITQFAPQAELGSRAGTHELLAMLAALAIGAPLYVCATASAPIAASLISAGLPPGAALVFLVAGPATNVSTMGAVWRTLGGRTLAAYLLTVGVGSLVCGLAFDRLLSTTSVRTAVHHAAHHGAFAQACAVVLLGLMAWFAWQEFRAWLAPPPPPIPATDALPIIQP